MMISTQQFRERPHDYVLTVPGMAVGGYFGGPVGAVVGGVIGTGLSHSISYGSKTLSSKRISYYTSLPFSREECALQGVLGGLKGTMISTIAVVTIQISWMFFHDAA